MNMKNIKMLAALLVALVIAGAVAWAGSRVDTATATIATYRQPLLLFCATLAFAIQWVAFVSAYALQTEKFHDLAGSLSFLALLASAAHFGPPREFADKLLLLICAAFSNGRDDAGPVGIPLLESGADGAGLARATVQRQPGNRGRFIGTGLWAWSRHHNNAGEILLRVGVFTVCAPVLWPRLWPKAPPA